MRRVTHILTAVSAGCALIAIPLLSVPALPVLALPPAGAALVGVPPDVIVDAPPAVGTTGADGNVWQPAR